MKSFLFALMIVSLVSFSACGGGSTGSSGGGTTPPPTTFTISVTVTGLSSGATLVLQDDAGKSLTFTSNTSQVFSNSYTSGKTYSVVFTPPTGEQCTASSNSSGTITGNVTVAVSCTVSTATFTLGVQVSGLSSGATLILQDDAAQQLTFTSNTTQTFPNSYASGAPYSVGVVTQPTGELCSASNSSGTMTANTTVAVTCAATVGNDTISAAVTGLTGTLVLQDDSGVQLTFTSNTTQTFSNSYLSGASYSVTVSSQPVNQTCTLGSNSSGTITSNITVAVTCSSNPTLTISTNVSGLSSGTLVLKDDAADTLSYNGAGGTQTFATKYASGASYAVTIQTQPAGSTCTLGSNATGTITSNITVNVTCTANPTYSISTNVTGLTTGTLVLHDDLGDNLTYNATGGTQTFATKYASGASYTVSIQTQPIGETCSLGSNATGTITSNLTVTVTCSSVMFSISATVTGLTSGKTLVLQDDKSDTLSFTTNNASKTFATKYNSGSSYTVSVKTQPAGQSCTLSSNSTGTISADTTVTATCANLGTHPLGTVTSATDISCQGSIKNGACKKLVISCPNVADFNVYVKTNTPTGTSLGTVAFGTGTGGNGLYESLFTFGDTVVQDMLDANYTTSQITFGTPFDNTQPDGWPTGPVTSPGTGVLTTACRFATALQWVYDNVQNDSTIPMCATANSGGAGALAYALSQYGSNNILSMAEVTSGPPTGRLDWGCGCSAGSQPVPTSCFPSGTMGTCFGTVDAGVWDPAYTPHTYCSDAVKAKDPSLYDFLGDSVEAPGATYNFPKTKVNILFGGTDTSAALPSGWDWYSKITSSKSNGCVADAPHSIPNVADGAAQIASDLINMCKKQ